MSDEDAEAVVASALSFLDEFYAAPAPEGATMSSVDAVVDSADGVTSPGGLQATGEHTRAGRPTRRRDTNRARALASRELLALRAQVSVLESELESLNSRRGRRDYARNAGSDAASSASQVWKDIAASQLNQCLRSKCENQRLRRLVSKKRKVLLELRRYLISRVVNEATREFCVSASELRLPALNLEVIRVMQELSRRADATYSRVEAYFDSTGSGPASSSIVNGTLRKLVARHSLPFDASSTGVATWHHLSRVIRPHATSLFSYRDEGDHTTSTVTEYFGMKLTHGPTSAEFRVTQTMRRYVQSGREIIIYESVLHPMTFNGKCVQAGAFQERGILRITPQRRIGEQQTPLSSVEVCYNLAPPNPPTIQDGEATEEELEVDVLTKFVLQSMMAVTTTNFHKIENVLFDDAVRRTTTQESSAAGWNG